MFNIFLSQFSFSSIYQSNVFNLLIQVSQITEASLSFSLCSSDYIISIDLSQVHGLVFLSYLNILLSSSRKLFQIKCLVLEFLSGSFKWFLFIYYNFQFRYSLQDYLPLHATYNNNFKILTDNSNSISITCLFLGLNHISLILHMSSDYGIHPIYYERYIPQC